jgi:hypothetical protein
VHLRKLRAGKRITQGIRALKKIDGQKSLRLHRLSRQILRLTSSTDFLAFEFTSEKSWSSRSQRNSRSFSALDRQILSQVGGA